MLQKINDNEEFINNLKHISTSMDFLTNTILDIGNKKNLPASIAQQQTYRVVCYVIIQRNIPLFYWGRE